MLKVEIQGFDNLSESEQKCAADNGSGKEYATYVRVTHNGETLFLENDAMEPEDCRYSRDMSWVKDAIERAYELGKADASPEGAMSKAMDDVRAERERQIGAEDWSTDHDDNHDERELARAASCYLNHYIGRSWLFDPPVGDGPIKYTEEEMPDEWPWDSDTWKPKAPRRDLVRAAALLIAEIERLDRR